jgi:hypothetical protein
MKLYYIAAVAFLASLTLAACSDPQHNSRTGKGALIGGAVGADAGAWSARLTVHPLKAPW